MSLSYIVIFSFSDTIANTFDIAGCGDVDLSQGMLLHSFQIY